MPAVPSADFSDGTTFGTIKSDGGLTLTIIDDPVEGVVISAAGGAGTATVTVCTEALPVSLVAGSTIVHTCGSVIVTVIVGSAQVDLGGGIIITVGEAATVTITDLGGGEFLVENTGGEGIITIDDNGAVTELTPGSSDTVAVPICADVTGDGIVNARDVVEVVRRFGSIEGDPGFDPASDLNADGVISLLDLLIVVHQMRSSC